MYSEDFAEWGVAISSLAKSLILLNWKQNKIRLKPCFEPKNSFYFNLTSDKAVPCPYSRINKNRQACALGLSSSKRGYSTAS
ncbi:hypothetical protein [Hugenholtzia roseola]|uniref:hypothetical protein n=1 Tax=Hugenholtzia roseola TaxID=1002 RepID=UPI00040A18B4|nr:hypothetical protein [Hugenholtzia roseola]